MSVPRPPKHLTDDSRRLWREVVKQYDLTGPELRLLRLALEAVDRAEQARRALDEHGIVTTDRYGNPRARPEVAIERDARLAAARLFRQLGLDSLEEA